MSHHSGFTRDSRKNPTITPLDIFLKIFIALKAATGKLFNFQTVYNKNKYLKTLLFSS